MGVTMMLQHLKGVFNWDSEQLHDAQIGHQTGNSIIGPEVDQARLQGHKQNFVTQKKCELEGYIGKRIATLKSEEAVFKERERKNIDVGKFLLKRLETEASGGEVDKYKLHVRRLTRLPLSSLVLRHA